MTVSRVLRSARKPKGRGVERREEILVATFRLLGEFGTGAVSTRMIAQASGISQPTLYAYFSSKEDIVAALHARALRALSDQMRFTSELAHPSLADLQRSLRAFVDVGLQNPDFYRLAFMPELPHGREAAEDGTSTDLGDCYLRLLGLVETLHGQGLLVQAGPTYVAQSLFAGVHGLVSLMIARPAFGAGDRERLIAAHLRMLTAGVAYAP
ncbi:TetR/AcrR family transcriptional regulator [Phenylobacterium sp. Root700]|uniref:TetR/AcrR family transcriptional regulator n=1 Tax=Phenylobacterium sp. Root700 TaxID=1736591 RepID=UPI00070069ED|nr:TetR/AcrR family transcriptional regulator [Phenylobacterium sp. Root700]KRB40961.1 hypothetical protein ASE02_06210 [Phenylobacterium sp. Root700]